MTPRQWLLPILAVAAVGVLASVERPATGHLEVSDSPSAHLAARLTRDFPTAANEPLVLLIDRLPVGAATDSGRALVRRIIAPLAEAGARGVVSPATSLDTLLLGVDGHSALAIVDVAGDASFATIDAITHAIDTVGLGIQARWTGAALLEREVASTTARALARAERVAIPLTAVAAVVAFGGLAAAWSGVALAVVAALVALALTRVLGLALPLGAFAEVVATIVAAALTLDYRLWMQRGGFGRSDVGRAGLVAACAFAALLLGPTADVRGAALAGLVAVAVAVLLSGGAGPVTSVPSPSPGPLLRRIARRPVLAIAVALPLLGWLAVRGVTAPIATDPLAWLPRDTPQRITLDRLEALGRGAAMSPVLVLADLDADVFSPPGWARVTALEAQLTALPGVADVRSVADLGNGEPSVIRDLVPSAVLAHFVSGDRRAVLLRAFAAPADGFAGSIALAHDLRQSLADRPGTLVGGLGAVAEDLRAALREATRSVIVLASLGCWLALAAIFRAPVIATKAVLLNLLVAAAAIGIVAVLDPRVARIGMPGTVPLVALGAAFALSIDYELVLLLAVRGAPACDVGHGVARAAPLFLRGGLLLAALLAAFAASAFAPLALLGRVLLAAILLDVLLVRPVVAPALLAILGEWNWWPGVVSEGSRQ